MTILGKAAPAHFSRCSCFGPRRGQQPPVRSRPVRQVSSWRRWSGLQVREWGHFLRDGRCASAPLSKLLLEDVWMLQHPLPQGRGSPRRGPLVGVIVFGSMVGPLLFMLGLSRTSASTGSLLLNLEVLATMGPRVTASMPPGRTALRRRSSVASTNLVTPATVPFIVAAQLGVRAHHWRFWRHAPGGRHSQGRSFEYRHLRPGASTCQRHRLKLSD